MQTNNIKAASQILEFNQILNTLRWDPGTLKESAGQAFKEALRISLPRPEAFCAIAEKIYRSYCPVNWGLLNWQWEQANNGSDGSVGHRVPVVPAPRTPPPRGRIAIGDPSPNGDYPGAHANSNGNRYHKKQNGRTQFSRRPASLVSYYV